MTSSTFAKVARVFSCISAVFWGLDVAARSRRVWTADDIRNTEPAPRIISTDYLVRCCFQNLCVFSPKCFMSLLWLLVFLCALFFKLDGYCFFNVLLISLGSQLLNNFSLL